MTPDQWEQIAQIEIEKTLQELPDPIREKMKEVAIFLISQPSANDSKGYLGLFEGATVFSSQDPEPPRITLWLPSIWEECGKTVASFQEEVRITLLHEIGHFLDWDEEEVEERGLG